MHPWIYSSRQQLHFQHNLPRSELLQVWKLPPVNALCGNFDYFTGDCLSCADPINFDLINGACVAKNVTCGLRQWKKDSVCFDVSATCGRFDPLNGKCLDCATPFFELTADGTCVAIVVTCLPGQYVDGLACVNIPSECVDFDATVKVCKKCIRGHTTDFAGKCIRVLCPPRQAASGQDNLCKDVSILCDTYDDITGDCLTCKDREHTVRDGVCLQLVSPLAGCQ